MTFRQRSLAFGMLCVGLMVLALGCSRAPEKNAAAEAEANEAQDAALEKWVESRLAPPSLEKPGLDKPSLDKPMLEKEQDDGPRRTTVTFMGSRGTGQRFCIIADHSQSLSPASLGQIKKEISTTLRSLGEDTPFYLIFFAGDPLPMPADNWRKGQAEIDKVESWMAGVGQKYGTNATPPFRKAMALQPRPDVVFLMTDGLLHGKTPAASIAALNKAEPKTVVHTILFSKTGDQILKGPARDVLETIARDSGGEYRQYVPEAGEMPPAKKKKKK